MRVIWLGVVISALVGCAPVVDDEEMDADADASADTNAEPDEEELDVEVVVVDAILVSTQGAEESTQILVQAEVTNYGATPITAMQLRSFAFADYWTRSSIFATPSDGMPILPGETVTLPFAHFESGALFDCAAWEGPVETDVELIFAVDGEVIEAPAPGNVRCRAY